jgi:hypothetical protein
MRRIIALSVIFLVATVWAVAQYASGAIPAASPDPNKATIQGCLGGAVGEFTLTDRTGTIYQLAGNTAKMEDNVGHTVRVTGVLPTGEAAPGSMAAQTDDTDTPPALSVISFEDVSPNCN